MSTARCPIILALLTSCASTVSGAPDAADSSLELPPIDAGSPDDIGSARDVPPDQPNDAGALDPRCIRRPCLDAPLLRATTVATWLVYPDGRTLVWGTWGPEYESSQPGILYRTPSPGPRFSDDVLDLSSGYFHACALLAQPRRVACWGGNEMGMLGRGLNSTMEDAGVVAGLVDIDAIAAFNYESWALTRSGAFVWGSSSLPGSRDVSPTAPRMIPAPSHALRFATGASFQGWGYLTSDGAVFSFGRNDQGAAGVDGDASVDLPTRVRGLPPAVDYSAGPFTSCAVLTSGEVYCWGQRRGLIEHDGRPPESTAVPERLPGINDAVRVYVGISMACALTRSRGVRCWGRLNWDRREAGATMDVATSPPGPPMDLPPVRELAVGDHHACALTMEGDVYCWGANGSGQLGVARFDSDSTNPRRVLLPR